MNPMLKEYERLEHLAIHSDTQEEWDTLYAQLETIWLDLSEQDQAYLASRTLD